MNKIFKYPFEIDSTTEITVPCGHKLLHAGLDPSGVPCVWALVNPESTPMPVRLFVIGTGHPMPDEATNHLGTFVHGPFVWHVFTA